MNFEERIELFRRRTEAFQQATAQRFSELEARKKQWEMENEKLAAILDGARMLLAAAQGRDSQRSA